MKIRPQEAGFDTETQRRRDLLKAALREQLEYPCPNSKTLGVGIGIDYGYTRMPSGRGHRFHKGIDMSARTGKPIVAAHLGDVVYAGLISRNYGLGVKLAHEIEVETGEVFSYWSVYAHLDSLGVVVGDVVLAGDRIGGAGTTGNSVGVHLHFEIRLLEDDAGAVVDPIPMLRNPMEGKYGPFWEDGAILRQRPADF